MRITEEMAGVFERNASKIEVKTNEDGSESLSITFDPELDCKSDDGKIFVREIKRSLRQVDDEPY